MKTFGGEASNKRRLDKPINFRLVFRDADTDAEHPFMFRVNRIMNYVPTLQALSSIGSDDATAQLGEALNLLSDIMATDDASRVPVGEPLEQPAIVDEVGKSAAEELFESVATLSSRDRFRVLTASPLSYISTEVLSDVVKYVVEAQAERPTGA